MNPSGCDLLKTVLLISACLLLVASLRSQLASATPAVESYEGEIESPSSNEAMYGPNDDSIRKTSSNSKDDDSVDFPMESVNEPIESDESDSDSESADLEEPESNSQPTGASSNLVDNISLDMYGEPHVLGTNIANARIQVTSKDLATAAGHHHHKKHYVHGKLEMGAETGKKGAFKWHDKHPVGGKGR